MEGHSAKNQQIKCRQCGHLIFYDTKNPFRPFCSERCQLIDLGAWADEKFRVPLEGQELSTENLTALNGEDDEE